MNSIYGNNNPRVHDHSVSVVVDARAYDARACADNAVIHVIPWSNRIAWRILHVYRFCGPKIWNFENHVIDAVDTKTIFIKITKHFPNIIRP